MGHWGDIWETLDKTEIKGSTYMYDYYKEFLGDSFRDKRVLEIGCGTGVNSILMAASGAKVSVMDYSMEALEVVKKLAGGVTLEYIHMDMFNSDLENEFDIVHSEGVVEHYLMPRRQEVLDIHTKAARKGGKVLIIVPNARCVPYRIGKGIADRTGQWIYGNEYPYTERELVHRMKKSGLAYEKSLGGEFILSFPWIAAPLWLSRYGKFLGKGLSSGVNRSFYRMNYNNYFANRWGRAIGVLGRKI
jgi:2-polyprenyl-3-methyl-5-hydroxy-6-metoxy-1,4-benzoquinol methylase